MKKQTERSVVKTAAARENTKARKDFKYERYNRILRTVKNS